jgi:predicted phosphoadenosine phosphosulfate sulfurtransferase
MLNEMRDLYKVTKHNDFEVIIEGWKKRFLKFYQIIKHDYHLEWEAVYRTCLFLEAMYGSELAKSWLFYDDTEIEVKRREESAIGALFSETAEYHVISRKMTKEELLNEINMCLKEIKKEEEAKDE